MILIAKNLHVAYGEIKVLRNISIQVYASEIVSIIGPNGAGKSTVLKTIAGLLKPISGSILHNGEEISNLKTTEIVKRGLCLVTQGSSVFPSLTVEENLQMGAFTRKDTAKIKQDLDSVYERFPVLSGRKKQLAKTMSGGEQRMLSLGMALILNPKILMLDEPSLGLSPLVWKTIFSTIVEINRDKTTIIIVEQNVSAALQICDRGYVLDLGRNRMMDTGINLLKNEEVKKLYLGG
jgi:branched-chain amino acid transport system ATP-binding protein